MFLHDKPNSATSKSFSSCPTATTSKGGLLIVDRFNFITNEEALKASERYFKQLKEISGKIAIFGSREKNIKIFSEFSRKFDLDRVGGKDLADLVVPANFTPETTNDNDIRL